MTKFGVVLPQHDCGPDELLGAARLAEQQGLDSVWLSDHAWGHPGGPTRPVLEGWTALAAVAASTDGVRVGSLVGRVSLRLPRVLAAMVETVARIAPGRFVAGLGIADSTNRDEQIAYGVPFPPRARRLELLERTIEVLREIVPEVPIWVGGASRAVMAVAAKVDGWNFWGPAGEFATHCRRLKEMVQGRMPETSWAGSFPGEDGLKKLEEAGADHVLVAVGAKNFRERIEQLAKWREAAAQKLNY
jgi:alkanesulfonate monooxygenase SsuD/methylene tetrahydromethanopterin reductase-like flavin-dependent oxidoreductase (luciferase family)